VDLILGDSDFERVMKEPEVRRLRSPAEDVQTLGPEAARYSVLDALPKAVAERFRRILPSDYEIHEIELKVSISGTPFGVGISGDATLKFGPKGNEG